MKKIALFLSIVAAAIACEQVEPITPPEIDFANPDVVIAYEGSEDESVKLSFNVNVDWTAELDQTYDWITITPTSGPAGEASITVIATANKSKEERAAVVKVTAGVSVLNFDIVQAGSPSLTVEPEEVVFPSTGGTQDVTVKANVKYVVTIPENDWLTYKFNEATGVYTLKAEANEAYAARTLTITLSNNVDGVSESVVVSQDGRAKVLWEKSFADYASVIFGDPIHVAYIGENVLISTGKAIHAFKASDASYVSEVAIPEGFVVGSMTNDDAGNVVFASLLDGYATGDIYAISAIDAAPVKVASLTNNVYVAASNLRAGGDVTKTGVVVMYAYYEHYWVGCDIVDGVAGESKCGPITPLSGAGATGTPNNGCVTPVGTKLEDGFLATYYTSPALMTNVGGEWVAVGPADIFTGNDNNCAVARAAFGSEKFAAVAVGAHFTWSATGAHLYDLSTGEKVYTYATTSESLTNLGVTADVALQATKDALYMYVTDLNRGKIACIEIK